MPAFTLLEMIIAITVFTIFIGFSIGVYLSYHRTNQEALVMRSIMLEAEAAMAALTEAVKENRVDYDRSDESNLALRGPDGTGLLYAWDKENEALSVLSTAADGSSGEALLLHGPATSASFVSFRVFPEKDPYSNRSEASLQYQPTVQILLEFSLPGRVKEEVSVLLQSSITSRFYQ